MNIEQARDYIRKTQPQVLHLTGKTSTGKSTFAGQLAKQMGYQVIELDRVVWDDVIHAHNLEDEGQTFVEVYKSRDRLDLIESFIDAAVKRVTDIEAAGHPVIIDGAVSNPQTLAELLGRLDDVLIVYLHPNDLDNYRRNLTSRFETATVNHRAGLPVNFWELVDRAEFSEFCETRIISAGLRDAIARYAASSQAQSLGRIEILRSDFNNVLIVDV